MKHGTQVILNQAYLDPPRKPHRFIKTVCVRCPEAQSQPSSNVVIMIYVKKYLVSFMSNLWGLVPKQVSFCREESSMLVLQGPQVELPLLGNLQL